MMDSDGHIIDGTAGSFFCRTPGVAEAYAILTAAQLARREDEPITIKSDCLEVIKAISSPRRDWPWEYAPIIADITHFIQQATGISIVKGSRAEVSRAHDIANRARLGTLLPNWMCNL
ncbi:hypothetical protein LINPERHAP2_LOCUS8324 [Linum perenne]